MVAKIRRIRTLGGGKTDAIKLPTSIATPAVEVTIPRTTSPPFVDYPVSSYQLPALTHNLVTIISPGHNTGKLSPFSIYAFWESIICGLDMALNM